jgi:hypothetical protein
MEEMNRAVMNRADRLIKRVAKLQQEHKKRVLKLRGKAAKCGCFICKSGS